MEDKTTDRQLQEAKDLFIEEDVAPAPTTGAGGQLGPRAPKGKQVSRTKIVFDDSSEDEEEREKRWARAMPDAADVATVDLTTANLSTDAADYEDPVEMAKLQGLDSDDEARLEEGNSKDDASSSDLDEGDFFEDVPEREVKKETISPKAIKSRVVTIPEGYTMNAPGLKLGAAEVRNYVKRVHRPGGSALEEGERQKRSRNDLEDDGSDVEVETKQNGNNDESGGGGEEGDQEEGRPRVERPIDPSMVKSVFGYNLSLDPRDLEENPARKPAEFVAQRTKRQRDIDLALVADPSLLPSDDEGPEKKDEVAPPTAGGGDHQHQQRHHQQYDDYEDEEEEMDEEEEALEAEIDDVALVASIEQMVAGCAGDPEEPRFMEFMAFAKSQQERLWSKEISVQEFAIAMLPAVAKIRGAVKQALRPPKPGPVVIDGVTMDM